MKNLHVVLNMLTPRSPTLKEMHRSQNPFDSHEAYDHFPRFSPSIFSARKTPEREGEFQWSIDNIAAIKPVEIDAHNHNPDTELSPETEAQIQIQVEKFFSQKTILPSPWTERQQRKHVTFSPHPPQTTYYHDESLMESQQPKASRDAFCQTSLTFPSGFDLESMVGPQFLYVDEDWANSSLRRKLFGRPQHREKSVTEEGRVKELAQEDPGPTVTSNLDMSIDSLGPPSRPLGQEEPTLFSPEVNVHGGGGDLPFNPVALALQSSFGTKKEDVFLGTLPSPLTPFTRTPKARRAREKDSFPQSDPAMAPTHCATTLVRSPPGTPSLSPINNTAMRQAATAAGAHPSDECGSTRKTTSTPARAAPGSHTQKTCTAADAGIWKAPTVHDLVIRDKVHGYVANAGLAEADRDSCSSLCSSPPPKLIDLNDLESEALDFTSEQAAGKEGANDTTLPHDLQDSVMEVSACARDTRGVQRNLTEVFSSCHPGAVMLSHSTQADSGVAASGYLGESGHALSRGVTSQVSEVGSAIGAAVHQERRRGLEAPPHPNKCSDSGEASNSWPPPNDSGVWGVRLKTSECCPSGNPEEEVMQVSESNQDLLPNHPIGPTSFNALPQLFSCPQNTKPFFTSPVQSHISPMESPLSRDMQAPHATAPPLYSSHPSPFLGVHLETPKSRSSFRGSFTRYQRSLGSNGHGRSGGGSGAVPSSTMIKDIMEKKELLKAKLQHEPIGSLEACSLSPSPFQGHQKQPLGAHNGLTPLRSRNAFVDKPANKQVKQPASSVQGKENTRPHWKLNLWVNQTPHSSGYEDWRRSMEHWEEAIRVNTPPAALKRC